MPLKVIRGIIEEDPERAPQIIAPGPLRELVGAMRSKPLTAELERRRGRRPRPRGRPAGG
jgi:hypothetical protein